MQVEGIRKICLSLPHVTEGIKWENDLCFMLGKKMFCVVSLLTPVQVSLKVTEEEFNELTTIPGIIPAPYVAKHMWILVQRTEVFNRKKWQSAIEQSYNLVKARLPKKIREQLK